MKLECIVFHEEGVSNEWDGIFAYHWLIEVSNINAYGSQADADGLGFHSSNGLSNSNNINILSL